METKESDREWMVRQNDKINIDVVPLVVRTCEPVDTCMTLNEQIGSQFDAIHLVWLFLIGLYHHF